MSRISKYITLTDVIHELNILSDNHILEGQDLQLMQKCLLDMYTDLIRVCDENNIKLGLTGGTLLGKVRHNGFIPWDDDLDLHMKRKDYNKFRTIFNDTRLKEKYYITGPKCEIATDSRFIRVYKKDTFLSTAIDNKNAERKISIDIFPLDYVSDNVIIRNVKGFYCNYLMLCAGFADFYFNASDEMVALLKKTKRGRFNYYLRLFLGWITSYRSIDKWYKKVDDSIACEKVSKRVTSATGRKHYFGEIVKSNIYFPFKKDEFYGIEAWIPNNVEGYLSNRYGNYMKIPPKEERECHYIKEIKIGI